MGTVRKAVVKHVSAAKIVKQECQGLAWDDISRIHCIFIFDETEPIHELDFCNFASSMCAEVFFNILLGS
jgi:hypothetical protein